MSIIFLEKISCPLLRNKDIHIASPQLSGWLGTEKMSQ